METNELNSKVDLSPGKGRSFPLVEALVVAGLIGILISIFIPASSSKEDQSLQGNIKNVSFEES